MFLKGFVFDNAIQILDTGILQVYNEDISFSMKGNP